ncbi:hypothetical protein SISSUDRAFT_418116 [Sistotremastrum suecicum HHB10207 ss-3]|uniref:Uncharacterized protein n=1 Tax=Sistotremastrum suecicum HHB10207 ss-3 TaxID=1314776 RepID=A0A165YMB2_9AGAM|nr:hypothetical protein SISSUDRAFT_418116 [Sistotremastrum suecicum HHB10207 ss-3]
MRHEDRKAMARKWLEPLINSLHSSLFASIACFITGFLYQLWTVAHSFSAWAPVLAFTSALGTFLSFFVVGIIGLTILHAVLHAESPFGTPFTRAIRRLIAPWRKGNDKYAIFEKLGTEQERDAPEAIHARDEALQRGCQLVTNTTEPAFLDGASSTFLDSNWGRTWTPAFSLVNWIGAISRMLATDTSFRAKITIASFLPNFIGWLHYHKVTANVAPFVANRIDILWSLVYDLYNEVYRLSTEHEQTLFKALVGVTSLFKDNEDLAETGEHVYQDAVVGVLCSFDTDTVVGERREILRIALESFASRISSGDQSLPDFLRFRILRAILAQPYFEWTGLNVAPDLIKGIEPAALQAVSQFLSHVRHLGKLGDYQHIIEFLHFIYPSVSHTPAPVDLDLSRILELACQDAHPNQWERYSHTLMEWIEYCDVDRISDKRSLSIFLHLCAHQDWLDAKLAGISGHRQGSTDDITRERAREYLSTINDLPAVKLEEVIVGGTDVAVVVAPAPLSIAEVNNASPSKRVAIRRWPWFSERTEQPDLEDPKRD